LKRNSELFLTSALTLESAFHNLEFIKQWIREQNEKVAVRIKKIPFVDLKQWHFSDVCQNLRHDSGKFFSIDGIRVRTNRIVQEWDQPIINQPEIGYLGFITQEFNGVLHFLMQAKIEPGNVNYVQLSPTLQATKSNYTQVHKGKQPDYLQYFVRASSNQILVDQLQSEQGARFLRKRNRNIIIKLDEPVPLLDNFIWLTLGQIKMLMLEDNLINMDTRTVISGISFSKREEQSDINQFDWLQYDVSMYGVDFLQSMFSVEQQKNSFDDIIRFITRKKCEFELTVEKIPLREIQKWTVGDSEIYHEDQKYFKVIAVEVEIGNREVVKWSQPMIEPAQEGICAFICKKINGVMHFAVQAKLEAGNFDIIEFAPTVQCLTGNYLLQPEAVPFLEDILNAPPEQILFDTLQSEEGGRFFREQNRNMLVLANEQMPDQLPDSFIWMTLNQLQNFIRFNNYVNIQARSLIAALSFLNFETDHAGN
jgi:oxidase EvaA